MSCGYALSNSYASFVLSNLPRTSGITRWLHAARLPFLNSTERASHSCIYVIMTFQRTCNCGNITKNKVHDETVFVNSCDGNCSARRLVAEVLLEACVSKKRPWTWINSLFFLLDTTPVVFTVVVISKSALCLREYLKAPLKVNEQERFSFR